MEYEGHKSKYVSRKVVTFFSIWKKNLSPLFPLHSVLAPVPRSILRFFLPTYMQINQTRMRFMSVGLLVWADRCEAQRHRSGERLLSCILMASLQQINTLLPLMRRWTFPFLIALNIVRIIGKTLFAWLFSLPWLTALESPYSLTYRHYAFH